MMVAAGFAGFLGLYLLTPLYRSTSPPAPAPAAPPAPRAGVLWRAGAGDHVILESPHLQDARLCPTLNDCRAYLYAKSTSNLGRVDQMDRTGRAARVPLPVRVIVHQVEAGAARVSVVDGPLKGKTGWVPKERISTRPE
jgi:hypothetical protein